MSTSVQSYPAVSKTTGLSRITPVLCRLPLALVAIIFTLISSRYLFNPIHTAASEGIFFTSPGGVTAARIGFAAFPLSIAIIAFACAISTQRLLAGLYVILTVVLTGTIVRITGVLLDHSAREGARLLAPEFVLLTLIFIAIRLERTRRKS